MYFHRSSQDGLRIEISPLNVIRARSREILNLASNVKWGFPFPRSEVHNGKRLSDSSDQS